MLTSSRTKTTQFHTAAFHELMSTYGDSFLSDVYIGWAQGFLDEERKKLEDAMSQLSVQTVNLGHPGCPNREVCRRSEVPSGNRLVCLDWPCCG